MGDSLTSIRGSSQDVCFMCLPSTLNNHVQFYVTAYRHYRVALAWSLTIPRNSDSSLRRRTEAMEGELKTRFSR